VVRVVEAVRITEYAESAAANAPMELPRGYDPVTDSPLAGSRLIYQGPAAAPSERPRWWQGWRWIR
jgi:hypothetical protein